MPSDIELIKIIYADKVAAINAVLKSQPFTPLASEATLPEIEELIGRIDEAMAKLQPE